MVLLKSVLSAMPSFTMSCFKLPISLCKKIQSALTRFWWDGSKGKKMCWVAWSELTRGKRDGDLGFRDIECFNDALLAKLSWRIIQNPTCLLARVLLGKYCHSSPFIDSNAPISASHGWRGIIIGKDLIRQNLGKALGDGKSTSIWYDAWLSLSTKSSPFGPPSEETCALKVSDLISSSTKEWNVEKVRAILPELEKDILCLKPSFNGAPDKFVWLPTNSGYYSVKSGYYFAKELSKDAEAHHFFLPNFNSNSEIWTGNFSEKIKTFMWKVMRGVLPTGELLRSRGLIPQSKCIRCGESESVSHLLFSCPFVQQIWKLAPFRDQINPLHFLDFAGGLSASKLMVCIPPTGVDARTLFAWICWSIWTSRNNAIFNRRFFSDEDILFKAIREAREWYLTQETSSPPNQKTQNLQSLPRSPVDPELILCAVDAAWRADLRSAGFGWVFHLQDKTSAGS